VSGKHLLFRDSRNFRGIFQGAARPHIRLPRIGFVVLGLGFRLWGLRLGVEVEHNRLTRLQATQSVSRKKICTKQQIS